MTVVDVTRTYPRPTHRPHTPPTPSRGRNVRRMRRWGGPEGRPVVVWPCVRGRAGRPIEGRPLIHVQEIRTPRGVTASFISEAFASRGRPPFGRDGKDPKPGSRRLSGANPYPVHTAFSRRL